MIIAIDARPLMTRQIGGAEQHARNIVTSWAQAKVPHDFLLICDRAPEQDPDYDEKFVAYLPVNFHRVEISGFESWRPFTVGSRILSSLSRTLGRLGADAYHSFTAAVPRTTICPVVQTIHDLSYELDPVVRRMPQSADMRRTVRSGVARAAAIVAVSSQTKSDIASFYHVPQERIAVVYNGINPLFVPQPDDAMRAQIKQKYDVSGQYIFVVGNDIPRRNYTRLIEAMNLLWQTEPRVRLVMAGRKPWRDSPIFLTTASAQSHDQVRFVESPTDEELAQLYRDAIATCCASSFEGFGLSVLESMACGTPTACSEMQSLKEVAGDAAVYFAHDNPDAIHQALMMLVHDIEYRRQLKYRGISRAQLFTWPMAGKLILNVLERAAAGMPAGAVAG